MDAFGRFQSATTSFEAELDSLNNAINSKVDNPSTVPIVATSFIKSGGTNFQYLMADGSVTTSSGASGNSSNIYLYNSSTNTAAPPGNGQIRYNNVNQSSATEIYVSHLTRDGVDIDEFLSLITELSIIYIQDQNSSLNYIKYTLTGQPTIILNDYITIPVIVQSSAGDGNTNFQNGHNIFMSIFTNQTEIDNRITTLESKTQTNTSNIATNTTNITTLQTQNQNQSATIGNTTFNGTITGTLVGDASLSKITLVNGGNNILIEKTSNNLIANKNGVSLITGVNNCCFGTYSGNSLTSGIGNTFYGYTSGRDNNGTANCAFGTQCLETNTGNFNVAIGVNSGSSGNLSNTLALGSNAVPTASNTCVIGSGLTEVKTDGLYIGSGFKTPTGTSTQILLANGTVDSTALSNISTNTSNITTLQTKTQNQSATLTETSFLGNITSGGYKISGALPNQILYSDGSYNTTIYDKLYSNRVGIGMSSGSSSQGVGSVNIGFLAGTNSTNVASIAIGMQVAQDNQGVGAIALGYLCAMSNQGQYSISIGTENGNDQAPNSVIISAGTGGLGTDTTYKTQAGFFIKPVRNINNTTNILTYNTTSKELTYNNTFDLSTPVFTGVATASGYKTPTGTSSQILLANGTVSTISNNKVELNNNMYYNSTTNAISYRINTENWRYQSWGYYGGAIQVSVDCQAALMTHLGGSLTVIGITGTSMKGLKIRTDSAYSVVANGSVSGWLGSATMNYLIPASGFYIKIGFSLDANTSTTNNRTMIGLFQSTTAPALNNTTTIASILTGSMGIVQEKSENFFSFNTRGTTSSTKITSTIPCDTPNNHWYWLEMMNEPFSNDITLILTCQNALTNTIQKDSTTFTCGTASTMPIATSYVQIQQNMASVGGINNSAVMGLGNIIIKTA